MTERSQADEKNRGGAPDKQFQVSPPQLNLPKGGGTIRGIGEKFSANPVTGTGTLGIPIYATPGRAGLGPQLSLSYSSGSGKQIRGAQIRVAIAQKEYINHQTQMANAQQIVDFLEGNPIDGLP